MAIADRLDDLRACRSVAGDWLAVGLDPRPERLQAFSWTRPRPASLTALVSELVGEGVGRFVVSHANSDEGRALIGELVTTHDAEVLVAGGVNDVAELGRLREAGVSGVILGEALLSGAIDFARALEVAA
jgi:phosphoribosylformimino-5-aminoimidazole carboxamide ribonucleotide (ProFAR) isomerase